MATIPPRAICCDITDPDTPLTTTRRYAIHRGDTYEDDFQVTDTNEDPVDLTGFVATMQIREGPAHEGWPVIGTGTVVLTVPLTGVGEYDISSATTGALVPDRVFAEIQIANDTNPFYSATYKATVFELDYLVRGQVTV